jgi:SNF family Na+-dependent transporter
MPLVINKLPFAAFFGFLWFFLLFLAGITSSVSLAQPAVAFLEDEFDIDRKKAVLFFSAVAFLLCQPAIFFLQNGVVDELDFWGGTFFLVVFATIETILFAWVFGMENAWDEIHKGADLKIPGIYKFIIKYVTPLFLFFILGMWFFYQPHGASESQFVSFIKMRDVAQDNRPFVLGARIGLVFIFLVLAILVKFAWKRKKIQAEKIR